MNTPIARPVAPGQSLADKHPELLAEWDYQANDLDPAQVTPGSGRIAYWVCSQCGQRWASKIAHRTSGKGCMMCGRQRASAARARPEPGESLADKHPELVSEWNHELNDRGPEEVTAGSNLRAHWKCRDCGHLWQAIIKSRAAGAGCPACANRVPKAASVSVRCPDLVPEWDGDRNDRAPSAVRPGSDYRAYWVCRSCGHQWRSRVSNRTNGTGCPVCRTHKRMSPSEETAPCEPSSPHRNDMTTSEYHAQAIRSSNPTSEVSN